MQSVTIPTKGITFSYLDSGVPADAATAETFIVIHGHSFNANVWQNVMAQAPSHGARIIAINRRNYPGSTEYDRAEAETFANGSLIDRVALMKEEGAILDLMVDALVSQLGLRSVNVLGWSMGNAFLMSMIAAIVSLPASAAQRLQAAVKTFIMWDAPITALGFEGYEYNTPLYDESIPPEARGFAFVKWVSSYFVHDLDTPARDLAQLKVFDADLTRPPTIEKMGEKIMAVASMQESIVSDVPIVSDAFQPVLAEIRRAALFSPAVAACWSQSRVVYLWNSSSCWNVVWASWTVEKEAKAAGGVGMPLKFKILEGGNHMSHWDLPEKTMATFVESVKA
ncbi:Alpha/Beta hydrolase protein [Schizophyllum commune]